MAPHQWFVALATLLLLFAACGGDEEQPPAALADADALAFVYATKPTTPVLLVYKSGEALTILGENGNGAASGAVFAAPRLDPLIVEAGERGLPTRAYVSGYTFVFRNWRQTAVDVGVVDASGATQALPDVQWPDDVVSPTLSLGSASVALAIRDAYDLIGAAACVIREATASLDHNVTFPTVGAACTRLATKITVALLQEDGDSSRWQEALDLTDASLVAAGCVVPSSSTAINCADFVLAAATEAGSEARRAAEAAEEPLRQLADELRPAVTGAWKGAELIATLHAHVPFVRTVAFAPDGATLAGGGDDKVKLWDVATQQEIATLDVLGSWGYLAFSPDGATLAVDVRGYVELWDINAREQIGRLGRHPSISAVAFSPDGTRLASGDSRDDIVKVWDVASGQEMASLKGHTFAVNALAFSPGNGPLVVATYMPDPIKLWDTSRGRLVGTLPGHSDNVRDIALSPDGDTLASSSDDGTVKLWSLDERREIATLDDGRNLPGRDGAIYGVAFSPDGLTLATAVRDSLVKLWNPRTQREIAALTGHQQRVVSVAFAPNGELLASGGGGTVRLWARTR